MLISDSFTWTDVLAYATLLLTLFLLHSSILSTLASLEYAFENISRQAPFPLDTSFYHDHISENPADPGSSAVNGYSSRTPWLAAVSLSFRVNPLRHVSDLGRVSSQLAAISLLMIIVSIQALLTCHHLLCPTVTMDGWISRACSASHQRMQAFNHVCSTFFIGLRREISHFSHFVTNRMKTVPSIRRHVEPGEIFTSGTLGDDMVAGEHRGCPLHAGCPLHTTRFRPRCAVHDSLNKDAPVFVPRQPEAEPAHPLKSNLSPSAPAFTPQHTSTSTSLTPESAQSAVAVKPRGRLHCILATSLSVFWKAKVNVPASPPVQASSQASVVQQSEPFSVTKTSSASLPTTRLNKDAPVFTPGRPSPSLALPVASPHDRVPGLTGKDVSTLSSSLSASQRPPDAATSESPATPVSNQFHCDVTIADGAVSPFVPTMTSTPKKLHPPPLSTSYPNEVESPVIYSTQPRRTQMTAGPVAPMAAPVPCGLRQSLLSPRPALGPANRMNLPALVISHHIPQDSKGRPLPPTAPALLAERIHKPSVTSRFPVYKGYKSSALFPA